MEGSVEDVDGRSEIERVRELGGDAQGVGRRRRAVLADGEVQRFGADVILHEIRGDIRDAARERSGQRRVRQVGGDEPLEGGDQLMNALWRQIELEEFDRDEPLTLRVVRPEDRPEGPRADLMKNTKRSERVWRRCAGSFRVQ